MAIELNCEDVECVVFHRRINDRWFLLGREVGSAALFFPPVLRFTMAIAAFSGAWAAGTPPVRIRRRDAAAPIEGDATS